MEQTKFSVKNTLDKHDKYTMKTSSHHTLETPGRDLTFLRGLPQNFLGVPLRRRGYRDAYKFVVHYNNITWLQRTGSSTEIFYFLNWAVHIIGKKW